MNLFVKTLSVCAVLGGAVDAHAALVPNGDFETPAGANWAFAQENGHTVDYPPTGGNSGGYAQINGLAATQTWYAVLIANNNNYIPLATLGLNAGQSYTFYQDMKIFAGANLGGLKLEWQGAGDTGDMIPAKIGDGSTWEKYTFTKLIPANATGVKFVPLWGANSNVGFDNIGVEGGVVTPPPQPPNDLVHENVFNEAGTNWGTPTGAAPATVSFAGTEGNPPGSTVLNVAGTGGVGDNFFTYTATGIDFGDGPVEISFDVKRQGDLIATAVHVLYNGNFVPNLETQINGSTFSTVKKTFNLNQGFLSETFTLQFQYAMGPVPGNGGTIIIDNIRVKTNLPGLAPPTTASIETGKLVGWEVANPGNSYQPQESSNNVVWTNLGAPITNPDVSSVFDSTASRFYRVRETNPVVLDNQVYNPGFEIAGTLPSPADGWNVVNQTNGSVAVAESYPGGYVANGGSKMLVLEVHTPSGTSGPGGAEIRSSQLPVTGGTTYNFSFFAANVIKSGVSGEALYSFRFVDEFGSEMETETDIRSFLTVGTEWTKVVTTVEVPADAAGVRVGFEIPTGPFPDLDYVSLIDDISLDTGTVVTPSETTTIAATAPPAVKVSWKTVTGRDYQVKSSATLAGWDDFGTPVAGDGSVFSVTDLIALPSKFYRVQEITP